MRRLVPLALILFCIIGLLSSCEKVPFLILNTPNAISFPSKGGTQMVSFSANRDWTISSSKSWCRVSPAFGQKSEDEISFIITCDPNTIFEARYAVITIKAEEFVESLSVSQEQTDRLLVQSNSFSLSSDAQSIVINVISNVNYSVSSDADWFSVSDDGASTSFVVNVQGNDDSDNYRIGHITLSKVGGNLNTVVTIAQDKAHSGIFYSKEPHFSESMDLMSLIWRLVGANEYNECQVKCK